ncbi:hypothetical protein VPH35_081454 [Triticum aestivum]
MEEVVEEMDARRNDVTSVAAAFGEIERANRGVGFGLNTKVVSSLLRNGSTGDFFHLYFPDSAFHWFRLRAAGPYMRRFFFATITVFLLLYTNAHHTRGYSRPAPLSSRSALCLARGDGGKGGDGGCGGGAHEGVPGATAVVSGGRSGGGGGASLDRRGGGGTPGGRRAGGGSAAAGGGL